ncbi:MAG: spermidine synthase [Proteobacteria bacterium]|nr:spermidine synthase [Pseudomonadota bacterium]
MNDEREYLDSSERSIGMIYLAREPHPDGGGGQLYNVWIDGQLLMSDVSPKSERQLATSGIAAHKGTGKLRILVGGLGLGHTAHAALESPRAAEVLVVDAMDFVIDWIKQGLIPLSEALNSDERLVLALGDVYGQVLAPTSETWDVILIDVDHSPEYPLDPASLVFYTVEGQARVRKHLNPGGILAVWSAHNSEAFAAVMAEAYPESWRESVKWTVHYAEGPNQELDNTLFFGRNEG